MPTSTSWSTPSSDCRQALIAYVTWSERQHQLPESDDFELLLRSGQAFFRHMRECAYCKRLLPHIASAVILNDPVEGPKRLKATRRRLRKLLGRPERELRDLPFDKETPEDLVSRVMVEQTPSPDELQE